MSLAAEISEYLKAQGVVEGASGWRIFQGYMPGETDKAVVVTPYAGRPPQHRTELNFPSVQVRVRGEKQRVEETQAKADAIFALLRAVGDDVLTGIRWLTANHSPALMGFDDKRRPEFVLNFAAGA